MNDKSPQQNTINDKNQQGQSIVLITFLIIGLIAFVGIAVDVGFVFARRSQLSKAVDAAALAAVTEVDSISLLDPANRMAGQFLGTNLPLVVELNAGAPPDGIIYYVSSALQDPLLSSYQYTITATWPIDLYFLKVVGWQKIDITESATAAYFPTTDIYASRRVESGALASSNQAVFGPDQCSSNRGDPYSVWTPDWPDWELDTASTYNGLHTYQYRIMIPPDYPSDIVRVELFDPDSINQPNNNGGSFTTVITHTNPTIGLPTDNPPRIVPATESLSCSGTQYNPCLIDTDERYTGLSDDQINPWWFVRIDENRTFCGGTSSYNTANNTQTIYDLYYFAEQNDGTPVRVPLAQYIGQVGDGVRDNGDHQTDMRWVSPGGSPAFDRPAAVAAAWPAVDVPAIPGVGVETFEISISNDLSNILVDGQTGNRYIYLDVQAFSGSSENGFEIWAGPPDYVNSVPGDVNARNVYIVNNPGGHSSKGATVFGLSNLPMNSNFNFVVDIPLIYVPSEFAGATILVSLFDSDSGANPPVTFYFDSIAFEPDNSANQYNESLTDWAMAFAVNGNSANDPDSAYWALRSPGINWTSTGDRCIPGSCHTVWVNPPYAITIPTFDPAACQADPGNQDVCTPFFGGRLVARYRGGSADTYGWMIRLRGLPFLVR